MTMPTFTFDTYTLRPAAGVIDLIRAAAWMDEDVWHRGQFKPEFWLEQSAAVNCFVLEDAKGPIFFFRTQRTYTEPVNGYREWPVEIYIQFAPGASIARLRTAVALTVGFAWMQRRLGALGYDAVYFSSSNPRLIEFAQKRLGFVVAAQTMAGTRLKAYLERRADGEAESSTAEQASIQ